ncbi:MAG TPA: Hsp70 family protein [Anaeromyxobacteraceae bacterium]|nr:Hsp70 family protein [Anaeromyxobacteraceae bacterium]
MGAAFLGIDLGTTNSTAAVFDGERVTLVRNAQGGSLTPSVVRIDARGNVTVGERARRQLDGDPENTRGEFKRLMGTAQAMPFPAAGVLKRPQDLAAEVLRAIRADVRDQLGAEPLRAVVAVPALFEVPQSAATAEAARLAGFAEVELVQEPVASAIAAGWTASGDGGAWLVYDLGGGTFDASLLEERDGMLRVVGHDGDNFLGGRDLDWVVVDWALAELAAQGIRLDRADPAAAGAIRRLKHAAEEARIELSRAREAVVDVAGLGGGAGAELLLDRPTWDRLCLPVIDRSVAVCARLLEAHRVDPASLRRIVLVGGPTATPALRERLAAALRAPFAEGLDPMTLVAQGAALYAASAGLQALAPAKAPPRARKLWLRHPAMSADPSPHLLGRIAEGPEEAPAELRVRRDDGGWESGPVTPDRQGAFQVALSLAPRRANAFTLEARDAAGLPVPVDPPGFQVFHGLTIGDPPLSRSLGVALADDTVREFFRRGAPLPARRTFTQRTVEPLSPASAGTLRIPVVQGEHAAAHLCRLVGTLEIRAADLSAALPAGAEVEITLELDRGGRLSARARVVATGEVFSEVAHLVVPDAQPEALASAAEALLARLAALRSTAFGRGAGAVVVRVASLEAAFADATRDIEAARGGDADAGQKARRTLADAEAALDAAEEELAWPELEERSDETVGWAYSWVAAHGGPSERELLARAASAIRTARDARRADEVERQLKLVVRLGNAAFFQAPGAWQLLFEEAASRVDDASDLPAAERHVTAGRAALAKGDERGVRGAVEALWRLLPPDVRERRLSHGSGVR